MSEVLEAFRQAAEVLEGEGYECEVREAYSGRFMYGGTTPAIVTDAPASAVGAAFVMGYVYSLGDEWDIDAYSSTIWDAVPKREDSMGRSARVYY